MTRRAGGGTVQSFDHTHRPGAEMLPRSSRPPAIASSRATHDTMSAFPG